MRFMVHFVYRDGFTDEAAALVPAEAAKVRELTDRGTIEAFYWAADRSQGWFVAQTPTREETERTLDGMALRRFWDLDIAQL